MLIYDGPVDIYTLGLALINGNTSKICLPEEGDMGHPPYSRLKSSYNLALHLTLGSKDGQMLIYDGPVDIYTLGLALINGNTSKILLYQRKGTLAYHLILGQKAPVDLGFIPNT